MPWGYARKDDAIRHTGVYGPTDGVHAPWCGNRLRRTRQVGKPADRERSASAVAGHTRAPRSNHSFVLRQRSLLLPPTTAVGETSGRRAISTGRRADPSRSQRHRRRHAACASSVRGYDNNDADDHDDAIIFVG